MINEVPEFTLKDVKYFTMHLLRWTEVIMMNIGKTLTEEYAQLLQLCRSYQVYKWFIY
jgi:hypothetical protein